MHLRGGGHLTYCLNVHPGERWEDVLQAVRQHVPQVKAQVSPDAPFGVGLRLSARAVHEGADRVMELRAALAEQDAYAFTVNAFPYGAFHRQRVKETVYLPDWSDPQRLHYTLQVCRMLADLVPDGVEGSVSTVPLGYRYGPEYQTVAFLEHLNSLAQGLHDLEMETGTLIHVGLEPEPDCILETTDETLAFFRRLFASGDEALLRRHLGVCLDTCHVALQFEDPSDVLRRYREAGVRVSKLQISAALEADADTVTGEDLTPFDDGVYFHQVTSSHGARWRDLPDWLEIPDPQAGTLRIHCHVPLIWSGGVPLRSTRHTLGPAFWREVAELDAPHVEAETYTFPVLPSAVRDGRSLQETLAGECRWVLERILACN